MERRGVDLVGLYVALDFILQDRLATLYGSDNTFEQQRDLSSAAHGAFVSTKLEFEPVDSTPFDELRQGVHWMLHDVVPNLAPVAGDIPDRVTNEPIISVFAKLSVNPLSPSVNIL